MFPPFLFFLLTFYSFTSNFVEWYFRKNGFLKKKKKTEFPCFAYTDWIFFFLNSHFPKGMCRLLLTFGMFHSLGYFLLILYMFQKPLRNTGFDKHFEGRKNPKIVPFESHDYLLVWRNCHWKNWQFWFSLVWIKTE